jgi:hypothetical protein
LATSSSEAASSVDRVVDYYEGIYINHIEHHHPEQHPTTCCCAGESIGALTVVVVVTKTQQLSAINLPSAAIVE